MFDSKPCTIMIDIQIHLTMGSRIEMLKNFGDISEKYRLSADFDTIFVIDYRFTEILVIYRKYRWYFDIYQYFYRFFRKFPDISYQSSPCIGYKICPIFFIKKHKMLFGNLIMIWGEKLCFSAWLKNRGFRVREI